MKKLNQRGFASAETVLILIVLIIIGGAGYFVYQAQNSTKDTLDQALKISENVADKKTDSTIPAGWKKYDGGSYSFSYPADWVRNECDHGIILLGPNSGTAGHCNSDATPEVSIFSAIGDSRDNYHLAAGDYPDLKKETVKIAGATGTKESGTLNVSHEIYIGPTNGTKSTQYVFYNKGKTYVFTYTQTPEFSDLASDFEQLVNKTLKFE